MMHIFCSVCLNQILIILMIQILMILLIINVLGFQSNRIYLRWKTLPKKLLMAIKQTFWAP